MERGQVQGDMFIQLSNGLSSVCLQNTTHMHSTTVEMICLHPHMCIHLPAYRITANKTLFYNAVEQEQILTWTLDLL